MGAYIGIDLGTTFSSVAVLDKKGQPVVIDNPSQKDGDKITPSCVIFRKDGPVIGQQARRQLQLGDKVFGRFKREMGKSTEYDLDGQKITPTDLSALVLADLKRIAEQEVGKIAKAVVTIPANFAIEAREATMQAAKMAGLNVDVIINEPTAAALYYAFQSGEELSGNYVVYDLGGGTFDVSVIRVSGQDVDVLASNGIARLGGDDFDKKLIEVVKKKYKEETNEEMDELEYTLNQAETDKVLLSTRSKIIAGGGEAIGNDIIIKLRRSDFNKAISPLLAQTELLCEATVKEAGLEVENIKDVILAGGSTRIPAVKESIKRVFGKEPVQTENVDEMIALGAALYAAFKSDGQMLNITQKQSIKRIRVTECANHYFGTIAIIYNEDKERDELTNSILIKKGQSIPCSVTETFYTTHDNQKKVNIKITQSGHMTDDPRFVRVIWEGELELPEGRSKGQQIEVTYSYDESERMHCVFKDIKSGREKDVDISMAEFRKDYSVIEKFLVD